MQQRLPLTEVGGEEILARVVYQIVMRDYRDNPDTYDHPPSRLFDLAFQWRQAAIPLIGNELELVAIWCAQGGTVAAWLNTRVLINPGRATMLARAGRPRRR